MTKRVINFGAGPAMLPLPVLERARHELLDWQGLGVSVMEIGHRTKPFLDLALKTENDLRELLAIPKNYRILFLLGGARVQFAMLAMNLLRGKTQADYIDTGVWSAMAIEEAKKYAEINIAASSQADNYWSIPPVSQWQTNPHAAYLHYTENETINGVEFMAPPELATDVPLVCDMTSSLMCKPVDISRFGMIYAGAQKNLGIAGISVVVIHESLLGNPLPQTPKVYDYTLEAEQKSMYPTPATFPWYMISLMLDWIRDQGGVTTLYQRNVRKAEKLYAFIDHSQGYYFNAAKKEYRSRMNVTFRLRDAKLEALFLQEAAKANLHYLAGHKMAGGGMRASLYNAIDEGMVDALMAFMKDFMQRYG